MAYDLIIIGAGHNGLTTAALQAAAGRRVLVLERRGVVGGLAAGEEFLPGYRSVGVLHDTTAVRTSVIDALGLEAHGLRREARPAPVFAPQVDGPGLLLAADPAEAAGEIRAHSNLDADAYPEFCAFQRRIGGYLRGLLSEPAPRLTPRGFGQYLELFKKAWGLRRLGRETMYECMRIGPMSVEDWLDEWFEAALLKATLAAPGLLGTWTGPRAAGTTALALIERCTAGPGIVGGPAALVRALSAACQAKGVEIRTGAGVAGITVSGGRVAGVVLDDGTELAAPRVASAVDPRQTFLQFLRPADLPVGLEALSNWRCRGTTAKVHLALDGPLEFASRPGQAFGRVRVAESMTEIERAFDGVKYGELPPRPHLDIVVPSLTEPNLAPAGHHVVSILVHFVPRELAGGWSDARRSELLELCVDRLAEVAPTCRDRIVGHQTLTPADLEQEYSLAGGHVHHGEHGLDQLLSLRPHVACARHATPLPGLYLCGSGSHPGGGITCAPAELAARAIG